MNPDSYQSHYSASSFWNKIKRVAGTAGQKVIHSALLLYYVMQRRDVPKWVKAAVVGALGYFIMPFDFIPDMAPLLGFSDDASMLAGTLWAVAKYIDDDVRAKAAQKLEEWFPGAENGGESAQDQIP
jgi:uncharacterized membrane protein YkvA (DUF1232 family)